MNNIAYVVLVFVASCISEDKQEQVSFSEGVTMLYKNKKISSITIKSRRNNQLVYEQFFDGNEKLKFIDKIKENETLFRKSFSCSDLEHYNENSICDISRKFEKNEKSVARWSTYGKLMYVEEKNEDGLVEDYYSYSEFEFLTNIVFDLENQSHIKQVFAKSLKL